MLFSERQRPLNTPQIRSRFPYRIIESLPPTLILLILQVSPVDNVSAWRTCPRAWLSKVFIESTTWKKWLPNHLPKGRVQNLWHFWIATVFCHRKEKANHFFQQTTPCLLHRLLRNCQRPHTWLSLFSQFLKPSSKGKRSLRWGFLSSTASEADSIGRMLFSSGSFPQVPSS